MEEHLYTKVLTFMDCLPDDRLRIIFNTNKAISDTIEKHNLKQYNNTHNRLSDVFNVVFDLVKIEIAPTIQSTKQELADYNSLTSNDEDLPLLVYHYVKLIFDLVSCESEDIRYCEHFIYNYHSVNYFQKNRPSMPDELKVKLC